MAVRFIEKHEYKVIVAQDPSSFEEQVTTAINSGWELCGGVSISKHGDRLTFAQAVMKPFVERVQL